MKSIKYPCYIMSHVIIDICKIFDENVTKKKKKRKINKLFKMK